MAVPTNGLTNTICRIPHKLSDSFLRQPKNSLLQIANITGSTRRSKSAVPGWYKRMSLESNNVGSDVQHAGMSPSSRYVTSTKNGDLARNGLNMVGNQISMQQNLCSRLMNLSRSISDNSNSKMMSLRTRSLPRWRGASASPARISIDRENEQANGNDVKLPNQLNSSSESHVVADENIEITLETPTDIAEHYKEESLEDNEQALTECMSQAESTPVIKAKSLAKSFQRTVNINMNDMDSATSEPKKKLSMDINVVVNVRSPESGLKPEIGFQKVSGKECEKKKLMEEKTMEYFKSTKNEAPDNSKLKYTEMAEKFKLADAETTENLKFGSEEGLFSQKDLTEEIGKVYDFLKDNDGTQNKLANYHTNSDMFQNYDTIKKLYVNALGCVKACKELRDNIVGHEKNDLESKPLEDTVILDELERCFKPDSETSVSGNKSASASNNSKKERNIFLASKRKDVMGVRTYSSQSDCEKAKKLPCLQSSELSKGGPEKNASARAVCDKLCMPCCKPARDPPTCFYPYHKPPCKKLKAPRPAFSECKQLFELKQVVACECVKPRATRCKKSEDSQTCDKR